MCGICGAVSFERDGFFNDILLQQMCDVMHHRGPDDSGRYTDEIAGLAMRRLSIIDLSHGHQPMPNEDETIWAVFNGEIYNYRELRRRLEVFGHVFATESDTEVVVHAYEEYGIHCVERFNGMFGLAIWDTRRRRLFLARDRLGIKPLYYWTDGRRLLFGSELNAVITHPAAPRDIDVAALDQFLTLEYVPAPRTIFTDIHKLPPGHLLLFDEDQVRVERYWDIPFRDIPEDDETCIEILTDLIRDAVNMRLVSDVPLGAFLSGGLDSSSIVAFMSEAMTEPVQTFSIGFGDPTYDELPYARAVSAHFGTDHYEEYLEPDIADLAVQLVAQLDEPIGDFSILPTYLVSQVARRSVKVVLSGDGGDELFGGYDTYVAQHADRYYRLLPAWMRQSVLPAVMDRVPPQPAKKGIINKTKRFVEGAALPAALQHTRWMMFMNDAEKAMLYHSDLTESLNGETPYSVLKRHFLGYINHEPLARQQYVDIKTYLADDILTKVDRMSMAVSLEARVPLLDHRIVEFAVNLSPHLKLHRGQTKVILRRAMAGRLPEVVLNKPKQGFSIPLKHWLRGPLRPLMLDLLSPETVQRRGYFRADCVSDWIEAHLNGDANHSHRLWALMVFELWHSSVLDGTTRTGAPAYARR